MKNNFHRVILGICLIASLILVVNGPALATSITINNYSFETPTLPDSGYTSGSISGWTLIGSGGVWNPSISYYPAGAPDGLNVAWLPPGSISQILSAVVEANYKYTLEAYVGKWSTSITNYSVELVASESGAVLAAATGNSPYQTFNLVQAEYTATNQYIGEHLKVVLRNTTSVETDFDKVTLTSTSAIPLPSTVLLLGSALAGLVGWRRLKKG